MMSPSHHSPAGGGPGIEPRWTRASKDAIGTSRSAGSHVWFTVSQGILNEIYWPTLDRPQVRDLQFLITDGSSFFHDEQRDLVSTTELIDEDALAIRVTNTDPGGRYRLVKEIVTDPQQSALLMRIRLEVTDPSDRRLRLYVLCAPHLERGGWGNNAFVERVSGSTVLTAHKGTTWMAVGASVPITRASAGYVGVNDGWQDLAAHRTMTWQFDSATDGNVAVVGELDLTETNEFTVSITFSDHRHGALTSLLQSLGHSYPGIRDKFIRQWRDATKGMLPLEQVAGDGGKLYRSSRALLLAHEDKLYQGALIASLSIPWGEARGDSDFGGYHLVWTRDMVNSATGLLAAGNTDIPLHALIYLAASQLPDGGFHQNFWVTGEPHWTGVQLDEVAFPIMLAWRLNAAGALAEFDPYEMVMRAAGYLVRNGPITPQERWEEVNGFSPSTLASNIAALTCAAWVAHDRGDSMTGDFLQAHADYLERNVERWTTTSRGSLLPGISRHYIRINPGDPGTDDDPDRAEVRIANRAPGARVLFPATDIVDAGFLELVRYGIRPPDDPLIVDSLRVIDSVLRAATPHGPSWYRYNNDGYGQRDDGGPFEGWGTGRPWPLLTGERAHYELAAGNEALEHLRALEGFARGAGLLPEQVWDEDDRVQDSLRHGGPTGAAMPLMWAHAEYIKLLRSIADGKVFDLIEPVADRYLGGADRAPLEVWTAQRGPRTMPARTTLRVLASEAFDLVWTTDDWATVVETPSTRTSLGISFADIPPTDHEGVVIRFTFRWTDTGRWEGEDHAVTIVRSSPDH